MANTMHARDTITGSQATCYATIGSKRYNLMQAINLTANFNKTKTQVPILGKTGKGNKATGWNGTGSATFHFNTSIFRQLMAQYAATGEEMFILIFRLRMKTRRPQSDGRPLY